MDIHNFAFSREPPQNRVVEKKNRIIQETTRIMLINSITKIFLG